MTIKWLPLIVLLVVNLALDLWLFKKLRRAKNWPRLRSGAHAVLAMVMLGLITAVIAIPRSECNDNTFLLLMWIIYIYYMNYVPRYLAAMVWVPTHLKASRPRTRRVGGITATVVGVAVFIFMLSGLIYTPYNLEVKRVEMEFNNLPQEFDGYSIALFSDTHLGTYGTDTTFISECVDSINALNADMICFTGDLVNRWSHEAVPFINVLSRLHASDGVISVLGNHDDAHYKSWPSSQQQANDVEKIIALQENMGWKVLENDHIILKRDSSEIAVVGTKCLMGWPFPKKGNLDTAYVDYDSGKRFVVLLQHTPNQWKLDEAYKLKNIDLRLCDKVDLMLSGHTHAMQCMFTIMGHNITPASLTNEFPVGLYSEGDHKLYTNIGLGMVGIPARLGSARPEVTLITLRCKKTKK